jgi:hypothetical protein
MSDRGLPFHLKPIGVKGDKLKPRHRAQQPVFRVVTGSGIVSQHSKIEYISNMSQKKRKKVKNMDNDRIQEITNFSSAKQCLVVK